MPIDKTSGTMTCIPWASHMHPLGELQYSPRGVTILAQGSFITPLGDYFRPPNDEGAIVARHWISSQRTLTFTLALPAGVMKSILHEIHA